VEYSKYNLLSAVDGKENFLTDEQIWIEAARRDNAEAWEQLVKTYQQPVFRLAYLLLGDADDADDVAQETFLRAHRALDRFDSTRPLRPWLMRITTNLCHNWRRSAGRYLAALQTWLQREPSAVPTTQQAGQQAEQRQEAKALWGAVRRMGLEDQKIIYLGYFLDCQEAEIAMILGVAQGTVKSRKHRALTRLRQMLQKEDPQIMQERSDVF
jgi:RNA polymerase sigma-70 factor, ECF subfamily